MQVPPFAFAGRGGNSRYMTPPDYLNFEPRFGFAWAPSALREHHVTIRGGYGLSHAPVSGFTRLPQPDFGATTTSPAPPSTTANPTYVMRLGENPPVIIAQTPAQAINAPSNGLVTTNSLYYAGHRRLRDLAELSHAVHPELEPHDLLAGEPLHHDGDLLRGRQGHAPLHAAPEHQSQELGAAERAERREREHHRARSTIRWVASIPPPARVLTVQNGSLGSPYLGFSTLYLLMDASANSIRHAGYISVNHRVARGLTFTSNYT